MFKIIWKLVSQIFIGFSTLLNLEWQSLTGDKQRFNYPSYLWLMSLTHSICFPQTEKSFIHKGILVLEALEVNDSRLNALTLGSMWARETDITYTLSHDNYSLGDKRQPSRVDGFGLRPRFSRVAFITSAMSHDAEHVNICLSYWRTTKSKHVCSLVLTCSVLPCCINN